MNAFSFEDIKRLITDWECPDNIKPEDIPSIELYMDQVTTFMEQQLAGNKRYGDDKLLTKTMINNYSKNNLLPPSNKKKYSKDHIIMLIYIYYLKNFLSIGDIQQLLNPMAEQYFHTESGNNMESIYRELYQLEREYGVKVKESIADIYETAESNMQEQNDYLKTFAMIAMLSYDIYAKKQLIEKLIDTFPVVADKKTDTKESKNK
ncbi:MAG: DUF1836 domain-containing protein [Lachnospiraceae bacterium]|nr:DUF1836 domain-containing protein [Lachnospiraceae bacterium]